MEKENRPLKVLIVDDDVALSLFLKKSLLRDRHEVFISPDLKRAQTILEQETIDILLADLILPGGDGSDIIKKVKQQNSKTYCVLISGYYDKSFQNYIPLVGADLVIGKPIVQETLDDIIKRYYDQYPAA